MGAIVAACAGWSIPGPHRHLFASEGSALERYASRFNGVEINSSFYRPHQASTYARWAASVPKDFRFSVKLPKAITHEHRLLGAGTLLDRFIGECSGLGNKLGGLLVQLPPSLVFDARLANTFFGMLRRRVKPRLSLLCEPRHPSWFSAAASVVWERHAINRIAADPPLGSDEARLPSATGRWRYWRLHGAPRIYYSAYSSDRLVELVPALRQAARSAEVWVVFDNTAHGHAVADAAALQSLLAQPAKGLAKGRRGA